MVGPTFRAEPVRVRVPATSANLGPGFDAFGLALSLYDEVEAQVTAGGLSIEVTGEGVESVPRDEEHLILRAMRAAFTALGGQPPGIALRCLNRIPHGRGLGSSAAAICAGVVAARALVLQGHELLDDQDVLALATRLEGHPDNVAACLRGGFTVAWTEPEGPGVVRLRPAQDIVPVAFIPAMPLSTSHARGLLPPTVPHADAAANAGRAALLVVAVTHRPDLLFSATEDRLHQTYRSPAMPESADLVAALRAEGVPAVISGAGPTVLALADRATADKISGTVSDARWTVRQVCVDDNGASLLPGV
jgi:homoserine kinase